MKTFLIAATLMGGAAGIAHAAPVTFDFLGGTGAQGAALDFTQGGLTAHVMPLVYSDAYRLDGQSRTLGHWSAGLGVRDAHDTDHRVDGSGDNNAILFAFAEEVTLLGASFTYADRNDHVEVFLMGGAAGPTARHSLGYEGSGSGAANTALVDFTGDVLTSKWFALGATDHNDEWKLASLTVDVDVAAVPVPAAGLLLLAGLGGLAAARRRA